MSYEVRVWYEDGTLMGVAEVESHPGKSIVSISEVDLSSGYAWADTVHPSAWSAEDYAREWAKDYADWCRKNCPCGSADAAESDCGVMYEHGISIQYCRDGWTVGEGD